ncbi:transposase [Kitasatospora griseola]|uniref:transposase n=1 Tax=Kitasatospora griseola TaxID=2064 RepID=UPI00381B3AF1
MLVGRLAAEAPETSDEARSVIGPLLRAPGRAGGRRCDHRQAVEAIVHKYRTGIPWRGLPAHFGLRRTAPGRPRPPVPGRHPGSRPGRFARAPFGGVLPGSRFRRSDGSSGPACGARCAGTGPGRGRRSRSGGRGPAGAAVRARCSTDCGAAEPTSANPPTRRPGCHRM